MVKSRTVTMTNTASTSTPGKRTLFRIALAIAMIGALAVTAILISQSGVALGRLRYFADVGSYPLHFTSLILLLFGLLALATFIILTVGVLKVNRIFVLIAAALLTLCAVGLIGLSIWSFVTTTGGYLPASINRTIVEELDQTKYSVTTGDNIVITNTAKMARLEKQYRCCGLARPIEEYRQRQQVVFDQLNPSSGSSSPGGGAGRGRPSSAQRNTPPPSGTAVHLPISCCNEKYRSSDDLCIDMFGNNTKPFDRYNMNGCYEIVTKNKFERIKRQGFITIIAACLAVISCLALAIVVQLLNEGYQIIPMRTAI